MKKTFGILYHLWYYVVMTVVIMAISPFIYITSQREAHYRQFFPWARFWARAVLFLMGLWPSVRRQVKIDRKQTYIICANHSSELDIMMTLALVPSCFVFMGKVELAKLPLFGYFYRKTNILVDRSSISSKRRAMNAAAVKLQESIGVCLFPEGGIPKRDVILSDFKMGAFKLAVACKIPILTLAYPDNRRHFPDFYQGGFPGRLRATIIDVQETSHLGESDIEALREETYRRIFDALNRYHKDAN